jgi:molybdopterin molybdotransferase
MISLAEAQAQLIALASSKPAELLPLSQCIGRYLAQDVIATRSQPAVDLSAMDGYAVAWNDMPGSWHCIGESAAGRPFSGEVTQGQAVRIFTGAAVPKGADTIIIQEDVVANSNTIELNSEGPARRGAHIRLKSNDFALGDILLSTGQKLNAGGLAVAAMAGYSELRVVGLPKIAYFSTGDELVPPGNSTNDSQLPSSNNPMIAGLVASVPCVFEDRGIVADNLDNISDMFQYLKNNNSDINSDIIVTSGGVSVGDHDLIQPALRAAGATIEFWKIAMKPGKPVLVAKLGNSIILGLPGNPSSAFVTAFLLLLPLIRQFNGAHNILPEIFDAPLANDLPATGARAEFIRASYSGRDIKAFERQDSGIVSVLANANALIIRPPNSDALTADKNVSAYLLP